MDDIKLSDDERRAALLRIALRLEDAQSPPGEEDQEALVEEWDKLCPHPGGTDVLFWPNELGLCRADEVGTFHMSAQQMVDYAMNWEPRVVAMQVIQRSGGESVGYYLYKLSALDTPRTQVVTPLKSRYEQGAIVAVALKGVQLEDGTRVRTVYKYGAMSCGKIIGPTSEPAGTRVSH